MTAAVGSSPRLGFVDAVKGLVVAGVIVAHAAMTYGLFGNWPYQEVLRPWPRPAGYLIAFLTMLGMGMLFFVAGMFTPAALERKGRSRFARDRLIRLGAPVVAYLLVVMPLVNLLGHWASGSTLVAAGVFARDRLLGFDLGPMWFVFALLLATLGYVAWQALSPSRPIDLGGRRLLLLAAISAAVTFLVRVVQPVDQPAPISAAGWPPDFALFVLGALAGTAWLTRVPAGALRWAPRLVVLGLAVLLPLAVLPPTSFSALLGGWHWQSAVVSSSESLVTIGLIIWIFRQFQRIRSDPLPWVTRGSFTAYLVQTPVILAIGITMRPLVLPSELKAGILAGLGLLACFGLAAAFRALRGARRPRPRLGRGVAPAGSRKPWGEGLEPGGGASG